MIPYFHNVLPHTRFRSRDQLERKVRNARSDRVLAGLAREAQLNEIVSPDIYRAGVTICAGTHDDQVQFVQAEMKVLVTDAGMSTIDAIDAATINGARVLRLRQDRGTVEVGKKADLLVLDKNPLITMDNIDSVNMVIKNGGIYKK